MKPRRMFGVKLKTLALVLIAFALIVHFLKLFKSERSSIDEGDESLPHVVWWTDKFPGIAGRIQRCTSGYECVVTTDRTIHERKVAGYLFYGTDFDMFDLPLPRRGDRVVWGLLHEESPRNSPILLHEPTLELFNYSSTISRHSHVPLTLHFLSGTERLIDGEYMKTSNKNRLLDRLAPVLYIQSDCDTASYRDEYVKELMKHVKVDSYGKCSNNGKLPEELDKDYLNNLFSDDILKFVMKYKFTIAIENGVCRDYITEKLWRPLLVGSVPICMRNNSTPDWLPNDKSAIFIDDFDSPKDLAAYILRINSNDDLYEEYLDHKLKRRVKNEFLIDTLKRRNYGSQNDYDKPHFVDAFECYVCSQIHQNRKSKRNSVSVLNGSHYDCPKPSPPWKELKPSWWLENWYHSKKESETLHKLVVEEGRKNFTRKEFYNYFL